MIANILDGRPTPKEGGPRTTIIVATTALCIQWKKEITKHTQQDRKDKLKVLSYTQRSFKTSDPVTDIQAFDIVYVNSAGKVGQ
jgi:superfamily II DNA or RNA helicase